MLGKSITLLSTHTMSSIAKNKKKESRSELDRLAGARGLTCCGCVCVAVTKKLCGKYDQGLVTFINCDRFYS